MTEIVLVEKMSMTSNEYKTALLNEFFAYLDVTRKTADTYKRALRQMFKYLSAQNVNVPCYEDILNFKKSLELAGKKPATVSLYLASCRRFFSWCEQKGICSNVAAGIKAPRQERGHRRDFFGASQLKNIFAGMRRNTLIEKRDFAIMALMTVCGLRTIEVSRANVEDIHTLGGVMVLSVQGKGRVDKKEFVKLPDTVLNAINDYLNERGQCKETEPLFAGIGNRNKNGRMVTRTISMIAKTAMRQAGYNSSRLSAHSLRHSAVTLSLLGGQSLAEVQAFARHSNIQTTQVYSHAVERIRSMCESTVCNAIFGA